MKKIAFNPVLLQISQLIQSGFEKSFEAESPNLEDIYFIITEPPNREMGHFAFPCFSFSKALKMAPAQIAAKLLENIDFNDNITDAKTQGPYLNFFASNTFLAINIIKPILTKEFFTNNLFINPPKSMVEYAQMNTHKEFHVGHMRNICLGNSLVHIMRYCKIPTIAVTYPGDVGTHVAKCLWYLKNINQEPIPAIEKGAWLGEMYTKANNLLEEQLGTEKEDINRKQLTEILKQLKENKGEFFELWTETRQWSLELFKEVFHWANVEIDKWYFESMVDASSVALAHKLHQEGLLVEDQGAIGMDLSEEKLGFCLLIKSDGTGLYSTKDVELARRKFEDEKIQHSIYVVDNRQAHHFKQVFKVLEKMGFEQAKDCYHLQYDVVELPDGAMSSRKGNIVPLMDLVRNMEEHIIENYLAKYQGDWTDQEIKKTAHEVASGAIKYGMIRIDNNRKIVFDMNEWLKLDGETGPYLQYVYARINSLVSKSNILNYDKADFAHLNHKSEISLLLQLNQFNSVVVNCAEQMKTIHLCSYLYDLGKIYNSFYAECPINKAETEEIKIARLALSKSVAEVMKKGLELLGIQSPDRM